MDDEAWKGLQEERFREIFRRSPVKRTGFRGLQRNIRFMLDDQDP